MTTPSELIILNLTKVKDNSVVIHTLSREFGRRSFIVSVGKGTSMAMFLPLNIVEAEIQDSKVSSLWRARNFQSAYPLTGIRQNIYKNSMTLFMSEVLYRTVKDGANEPGLYDWCAKNILKLDAIEENFANFHLWFLMEFAMALGFAPSAEDMMPFAGDRFAQIKALLNFSFAEAMMMPLRGEERNEIAECFLKYISFHTDSVINVQSLHVLRELFA